MIDVEELICELHHIAGSEQHDPDVRRTACDAESALASLRAWVNELQMNVAEREALRGVLDDQDLVLGDRRKPLEGLLARCATSTT